MSERILKVLLSELQTVRIICKKCAAVAEMTNQGQHPAASRLKRMERPGLSEK